MSPVSAESFYCCYRFQPENNQCPNTTWKPSKTVQLAKMIWVSDGRENVGSLEFMVTGLVPPHSSC